jgi:hypothetical protein
MSATLRAVDPAALPGLVWLPAGHSVLPATLIAALERLDRMFVRWAGQWGAEDVRFPVLIPAATLGRVGYFRSFPHLATFAVALDPDPANLRAFADAPGTPEEGLALGATAPVDHVLTPAACYHVYGALAGEVLDKPRFVTTRNICFRRERAYAPLRRQWSFTMRETVVLGAPAEVEAFLDAFRARLDGFFAATGLAVAWAAATDPFFDPRAAGRLVQRLDGLKTEMVLPDGLALGSINRHRDVFGEAFGIRRQGTAVWSGCVAFGLERCLLGILSTCGPDPRAWADWLDAAEAHA